MLSRILQRFTPAVIPVLQSRCFSYIPRKEWFPWRQKRVKSRNERTARNKNILPNTDEAYLIRIGRSPIKVEEHDFKADEISLGMKKLQIYARIIRNRHLQDAIDWMTAICRPSTEKIIKLLKRAQTELISKNLDPARLYVTLAVHERGSFQRRMFVTRDGDRTSRRSNRHRFVIKVREMPLPEFFHKIFILKRVPRAIVSDMAAAIRDGRATPEMQRAFAPYVSSASRRQHRRQMKYEDLTKKFDYLETRRKWIDEYQINLAAHNEESLSLRK